jgi:O-antigen/teichoic acid export membrane protein
LVSSIGSATKWALIGQFTKLFLRFGVNILLAKVIAPSEFGLVGMVTVFITIFNVIGELGLVASIIQKNEISEEELSSVFWVNVILGIFAAVILFSISSLIADFYNKEELSLIIKVLSINFITNALIITQNALLAKSLNFKALELYSTVATTISSAVSIYMAFAGFGVWALVSQQIINVNLTVAITWMFYKWRPLFYFNIRSVKEMLHFGFKVFLSSILNTIFSSIDVLIIGRFFSSSVVGIYSYGQVLVNTPIATFSSAFVRVLFPVLSNLQQDDHLMKSTYKRVISVVNVIILPAMISVFFLAEPIVHLLFNEKWSGLSYYIKYFALIGMIYPISAINVNIILAKGQAGKFLKLEVYKKVILVVCILIGINFGIAGILKGILASAILSLLFNMYFSGKVSSYKIYDQLFDQIPLILISIVYSFSLFIIDYLLLNKMGDITRGVISLSVSIPVFYILLLRFLPNTKEEFFRFLKIKSHQ